MCFGNENKAEQQHQQQQHLHLQQQSGLEEGQNRYLHLIVAL